MRLGRVSIVATVGALAAAPVLAGSGDQATGKDERVAAATAAVTLGRAVSAVESGTGGRAGYKSQDGTTVVRVDVVEGEATPGTRTDAGSGKVPATTGRDDERDGRGEEGDGGDEKE